MTTQPHALIIGAGIGGMAAGIALRRTGWSVSIYERAGDLRPVGAGLSLWANAVYALGRLGLKEQLEALLPPSAAGGIFTWRGECLVPMSTASLARQAGEVSVVVHRAELQAILHDALGPDAIRLGQPCTHVEQTAQGVTAHFADGSTSQGDLLIGADGIRSTVRKQLFDDGEPSYAGYTSYRGVVTWDHSAIQHGEYWGRGARFGVAPLSDGRVYWFATRNAPAGERLPAPQTKQQVLATVRGWCDPIEAIVQATPAEAIVRTDIADRPPLRRWSSGQVTLLGDAAHPTTPNLGQGGCQALEDAVALADALAAHADIAEALRAYESRRIPRTTKIVQQSRRIGALGQWNNPAAVALRSALLRGLIAPIQERAIGRVIGYRV
jgi:2-polyprenyl-6-methoxyphenol hydroxylase-like FAD-dependent oxidoreductase